MTEQEWMTSTDPAAMLLHLQGVTDSSVRAGELRSSTMRRNGVTDRKLRLFSCACKLETSTSVLGTAYAEMLVDGNAPEMLREFHDPLRLAQIWCDWDGLEFLAPDPISQRMVPKPVRADLLRHIVGNPWRQTTSLRVGDKVKASPGNPLACGSGIYGHAIVVSLDPFALVSEQGDMLWTATKVPSDILLVGHCEMTKAALDRWQREKQSYPPNGKVLQIPTEWSLTVLDLAQQVYDGNQDVSPLLHDALLDEGLLPESDLVRHFWGRGAYCFVCRIHGLGNPCPHCINGEYATDVNGDIVYCDACDRTGKVGGRHPKGCWALDLILGKE